MKACEKCGNEVKENNKFCEKCGAPVTGDIISKKVSLKKQSEPKQPKPKQEADEKLNKKKKVLAGIVILILIFLFTTYKIGESITGKDKVIDKFMTAISEKNITELQKIIKSSDSRLEINEENLRPLIAYIDENPSYFEQLSKYMRGQYQNSNQSIRNKNQSASVFSNGNNSNIIELKKNGKKFLIYDNYEFVMKPFFVNIHNNYKDAVIYINGKEVGKSDSDDFSKEYGPFAPGKYIVKAVYNGKYTTIEAENEIDLISDEFSDGKVFECDLYLEGRYVYIDTNYNDAKIIINGEDSGLSVDEINKEGLGPVDDTTKIQLSRDFPWGTGSSEEIIVGESDTYINIEVNTVNDVVREGIIVTINNFLTEDIAALKSRDPSKYSNLMEPELSMRKSAIDNMINWEEFYEGEAKGAAYDLDSLNIYEEKGIYCANIVGLYNYEGTYYYKDSEMPELKENQIYWNYQLKYDKNNDKWQIYNVDRRFGMNLDNVKEYNFTK